MKIKHKLQQAATVYLTAFRGILLGMLLVMSLAGCDAARQGQVTADVTPQLTSNATLTHQPSSTTTARPSRYATRTPAQTTPEATAPAVATLGVEGKALDGLKITFWHVWSGQAGSVMQAMIDEYNRSNPWKVTVEASAFDSFASLEESFTAALSAGDPPSVLVAMDDQAQRWNSSGRALVDLAPYVVDPDWGMNASEQADFYPAFWQQGAAYEQTGGGRTLRQLSVPLHRFELVLYYNKTWAMELGYRQAPDTPGELSSQACGAARALSETGQNELGGLMLSTLPASTAGREIILYPEQLLGWIGMFGGEVLLPAGENYQFNTPEALRAFELLKDLRQEGCIYLSDSPTPQDDFARRQALFYLASTAELPDMRAAFLSAGNSDQWTILPFPADGGEPRPVAYGPSLVIPQTSLEQQVAAWTLLEWLVTPSNQARWVQAIGAYPTRLSTRELLEEATQADATWGTGLELLANAQAEPSHPSWGMVRWVMGDALAELMSAEFVFEQIPSLLETIDQVVAEVNNQVR